MDIERTQTIRRKENLQKVFNQARNILDNDLINENLKYRELAKILSEEFNEDFSKIIQFIRIELIWPLKLKHQLLNYIRQENINTNIRLNHIVNFVFQSRIRTYHLRKLTSSIERNYGSAIYLIINFHNIFFLFNLLTFLIWLGFIILPYIILNSSYSFSNISFSFSSIFTGKDFIGQSIIFQGNYHDKNHLSLFYLLTSYLYYFIWFIFLTISYGSTYKRKIFHSILNTKLNIGFLHVFGRWNYSIQSNKNKNKYRQIFQREFLDFIENDERIQFKEYQTSNYRLKFIIINLIYILIGICLGGINWIILSVCNEKFFINCYSSIIYLVLINRLMPYTIAILTQFEQYKYLSDKLDFVGLRCIFLNICTIISFVIYFFIHATDCYERIFGQFLYVLILSDIIASLILPLFIGLFLDLISNENTRVFDGINIHVQISPSILLYSQFLILIGTYYSPFLPILSLINLLFSMISHRLYLWIRSYRSYSYKRVFIWNSYRLENLMYFLAYIILIISVTGFIVFTTQIKTSGICGPFQRFNIPSNVIENYINQQQLSVLWKSIIKFLTSPGFIYFLGVTFFIIVYKLRHESLAEKQLIFIRENNFENKKHLRANTVKKLHEQNNQISNDNIQISQF